MENMGNQFIKYIKEQMSKLLCVNQEGDNAFNSYSQLEKYEEKPERTQKDNYRYIQKKNKKGNIIDQHDKKKYVILFGIGMLLLILSSVIDKQTSKNFVLNLEKEKSEIMGESRNPGVSETMGESRNPGVSETMDESRNPGVSETMNEITQDMESEIYDTKDMAAKITSMETYGSSIENKLTGLITNMDGAGKTKVMLIMDTSSQIILARDSPYKKRDQEDTKKDESSVVSEMESGSEIAYYEDENGKKVPIIQKSIAPTIKGIVVLCEGGDKPSVVRTITEILVALFDLDEHRIKVAKLK